MKYKDGARGVVRADQRLRFLSVRKLEKLLKYLLIAIQIPFLKYFLL